ncbi:MAG TPA: hypothetical protein VNU47_02805 [Candidatus Paceibacterota bacterium]|nr:hypothetical protein [Candidatus Paceibacterota bacterium]
MKVSALLLGSVLTAAQSAAVAYVDSIDMSDEKQKLDAAGHNPDDLELELKKFFVLQAIMPGKYVIPGAVDQLWHLFLENQQKVDDLHAAIGMGIEHRPDNPVGEWESLMQDTKTAYHSLFGPAPAHLYDDRGMLCWGCGYDIKMAA